MYFLKIKLIAMYNSTNRIGTGTSNSLIKKYFYSMRYSTVLYRKKNGTIVQ